MLMAGWSRRVQRATGQVALMAAILLTATAAWAGSDDDPDYLALGGGASNVDHQRREVDARGEYRFSESLFWIKPQLGVRLTDERSVYAYGGIRMDLDIGSHFVLTPNFDVGYWAKGNDKNLGSWVEFKSGAEFAYRFDDHSRLGIQFDHMSNAGLTKQNPGVQSLVLLYSIPIGAWPPPAK
jgi:hypothetical protein